MTAAAPPSETNTCSLVQPMLKNNSKVDMLDHLYRRQPASCPLVVINSEQQNSAATAVRQVDQQQMFSSLGRNGHGAAKSNLIHIMCQEQSGTNKRTRQDVDEVKILAEECNLIFECKVNSSAVILVLQVISRLVRSSVFLRS